MSTAKNEAYWSDYIKVAIWWGGNDTFDMGGCKEGREEMEGRSTPGEGNKATLKEGE